MQESHLTDPETLVHVPVTLFPTDKSLLLIPPHDPSSYQPSLTPASILARVNVSFSECLIDLGHLAHLIKHQCLCDTHLLDVIGIGARNSQEAIHMILAAKKVRYRPFEAAMRRLGTLASTRTPQEQELFAEEFVNKIFQGLVKLSGFADAHRTRQLRAAFQTLEFRCLRKAYRPGHAGAKRARKEFEKEFEGEEEV